MLEFDRDVLNALNAATWQGRPLSSLTDDELEQVIAAEEAGQSAAAAALATREALEKSLAKWDLAIEELSGDCGAEPSGDGT